MSNLSGTRTLSNIGDQDPVKNNIETVVEEAEHSLNQEKLDYTVETKSKKKGNLFWERSKTYQMKKYEERSHEKSAKRKAGKAYLQYLKKGN